MLLLSKMSLAAVMVVAFAPQVAPPPIRAEFSGLTPEAVVTVEGAVGMATGEGSVWLVDQTAKKLFRFDPKTNVVAQTIEMEAEPCPGLVFGLDAMWVPACGPGGIVRLDPKTNKPIATLTSGIESVRGSLATAVSSLWALTDDKGTLARIDPGTNAVVAEAYVGTGANDLAVGQDRIWVSVSAGLLVKVNGYTNLIEEQIKVGKMPVAVAFGEGAAWVLNAGDGTVSRVDSKTNKVVATVSLGVTFAAGALAVGEGSVWVSAPGLPLARINPRTNRLVQVFSGVGGGTVFVADGSVWTMADATSLWRLDPKRIEATR